MRLLFLVAGLCAILAAGHAAGTAPIAAGKLDPALFGYLEHRGTARGRALLEALQQRELQPNAANIKLVREALAATTTPDERTLLVRTLGRMYRRHDPAGMNAHISKDLKALVFAGERSAATAAVFALSRSGAGDVPVEILQYALAHKLLGKDDFAGEIAHNLPFAPAHLHAELLHLLEGAKSDYGFDIFFSSIKSRKHLERYSLESRKKIFTMLERNEPRFSMAIGDVGYMNGIRFAEWLNAYALASELTGKASYVDVIFDNINNPHTDPRKVMMYLALHESAPFLAQVSPASLAPALAGVQRYAESFPTTAGIQAFAGDAKRNASRAGK